VNTRWVDLTDPLVFVNVENEPRVDEVLSWFATEMGSTVQETEAVGSALSSLSFLEPATRAADMEATAAAYSGEVEWGWCPGGTFICRPKPITPPDRLRWYVIDTTRCAWGVVADESRRVDYVCVSYLTTKSGVIPAGTPRVVYRPSTPSDPLARVGTLDMSENGPMSTAQAQDAGDQWLAWNNAAAYAGPVSGFGGALRTVDGLWVAASHARNGDWLQPLDLFDVEPQYITAVEVDGIDEVTLHIGGSEREFAWQSDVRGAPGEVFREDRRARAETRKRT
jgi:hypothetical protein